MSSAAVSIKLRCRTLAAYTHISISSACLTSRISIKTWSQPHSGRIAQSWDDVLVLVRQNEATGEFGLVLDHRLVKGNTKLIENDGWEISGLVMRYNRPAPMNSGFAPSISASTRYDRRLLEGRLSGVLGVQYESCGSPGFHTRTDYLSDQVLNRDHPLRPI